MADADKPRPVPASELAPAKRFDSPLFHRDGTLLLLAHAAVDEALVRALESAGIDEVFACETPAAVYELRGASELAEVDIASFPEGVPVDRNLYDEAGELVASRGQPLSNAVLGDLARRGVARLYEERSPYEAVRERFEVALASAVAETLEKRIEEDPSLLRVEPGTEAFADSCRRPTPAERTREAIEKERRHHALDLASTHGLLERVRHEGMLDLPAAKDIVEELLGRFERDLPLSLALAETALHNNYLVDHSFAVAAHAGACGLALGYDRSQCAELTLGGLLHDIGMARVSEDVIKKEGPLSPEELAEIRDHPRAGLELVKNAPGVSMPLPFAVFQDHERTDGRGYPLGLSNGWIHDHAKLIAVADCYQAMT
ncbi:MAG: HD-GYP domain-containing protein, partial [Planctomycetota bacterium]